MPIFFKRLLQGINKKRAASPTQKETGSHPRRFLLLFPVIAVMFLIGSPFSYSQDSGFKYIKNYTPKDYDCEPQNWGILQDKRGVIYVANQGGLLEFDGVSWRTIKIPNNNVRSMAMDEKGIIYIGGNNEIGFLAPDLQGSLQYVSLVGRLEEDEKNFSEVWTTHAAADGIYFNTSNFLFRWHPSTGKIKRWKPEPGNSFFIAFTYNGQFYIDQENVGLRRMEQDVLMPVPGTEILINKIIFMMEPYRESQVLIGTATRELFLYDGRTTAPFPTGLNDFLKEKKFYRGIRLSSGDFALATLEGGLVIMAAQARLKKIFDKSSGLVDDSVKYVFEDRQGNLWSALEKGITCIEYKSPISFYDSSSGLDGLVLSIIKHNNTLFAGTTRGLYYLVEEKENRSSPGKFIRLPGISDYCWSFLSADDSLLAARNRGVFRIGNSSKKIEQIFENESYILQRSGKDKNRIWVGTKDGLFSLYRRNQDWHKECKIEKVTSSPHSIIEDGAGNLWAGTLTAQVFRIDFSNSSTITDAHVKRYDKTHGLPGDGEIHVFWAAGHVMFASQQGIFRFDEGREEFIPDHTFGKDFAGSEKGKSVHRIVEDEDKNIWLHSKLKSIRAIPQSDGSSFILERKPYLRFADSQANTIYPDPAGNVAWFACNDYLLRYDTRIKSNCDLSYQVLIRQVMTAGKPIFYGCERQTANISPKKESFPILEYKDRNPSFQFAAPFFEGETDTRYSCFLEGYETDWTAWNRETQKDYSNLDAGMYRFRIKARNVYGQESSEAVFQFKVLPPWYKTWWAYLVYSLFFLLFMFLLVKWRSGKLQREKEKLEQIVTERTNEIEKKNRQLENQTRQLKEQADKLKDLDKVKSRFFANISHEFRTPLTLIMGPVEQMLSLSRDEKEKKKLNLMLRNSQRLLALINQLLELSKIESGKTKLQAANLDIIHFIKGIVASYDVVANKNEIDLTFQSSEENVMLYFDAEKVEEILFNLLSNAIKFTPRGGKITAAAERIPPGLDKSKPGWLAISICDSGPGIPREQLTHIFDRFYQADSTYEHHRQGTGIGLAIAKELVEIHHGSIDVHSSEGQGATFTVLLPLGKAHLQPDEISEIAVAPTLRKPQTEIPGFFNEAEESTAAAESAPALSDEGMGGAEDEATDIFKKGREIILVVEDSADVRDYIRGALETEYQVIEAADGREGIQKAQEVIPDLVISDIMMPGIDGYELCRQLKNDVATSHIPIILLTARAAEENIIQGLETGADDYITKPFNTRILSARIKNLIDLRSHLQQTSNREMALQPVNIAVSHIDKKFIKKLHQVIDENISDADFNIERLCKKMELSQPTLYRKIQALSGESPTEFIRSYRLKRGAELLKNNFGSVLEVALEVGFSSANYFTKCFKKKYHRLPSTFMETG